MPVSQAYTPLVIRVQISKHYLVKQQNSAGKQIGGRMKTILRNKIKGFSTDEKTELVMIAF